MLNVLGLEFLNLCNKYDCNQKLYWYGKPLQKEGHGLQFDINNAFQLKILEKDIRTYSEIKVLIKFLNALFMYIKTIAKHVTSSCAFLIFIYF